MTTPGAPARTKTAPAYLLPSTTTEAVKETGFPRIPPEHATTLDLPPAIPRTRRLVMVATSARGTSPPTVCPVGGGRAIARRGLAGRRAGDWACENPRHTTYRGFMHTVSPTTTYWVCPSDWYPLHKRRPPHTRHHKTQGNMPCPWEIMLPTRACGALTKPTPPQTYSAHR